jgi:hypothetical protein
MGAEQRIEQALGPVIWPPLPPGPYTVYDIERLVREVASLQDTARKLRLQLIAAGREIDDLARRLGES